MKKYLLTFLSFFAFASLSIAQDFNDDFESYSVGDYIGAESSVWSTWSGAVGGAEDAQATNDQASSGDNSIYFSSTAAGGGPQDVILPFGGKYTTGKFHYEMNVFVDSGNNGYFNFQGEVSPGVTWVLNTNFNEDGTIAITNGATIGVLSGTYTQNEWFNVAVDVNLTSNSWSVSIDGECLGSFANPTNFLASIDLFPITNSSFYVDDVSYSFDGAAGLETQDAAIALNVDNFNVIAGSEIGISGSVSNLGSENINSFDVVLDNGSGPITQSYDNLDIATGQSSNFNFDDMLSIADGNNLITVTVQNVNGNGGDDGDECNSVVNLNMNGFTPAPNKKVLVEEGTGPWCQFCPRGHVFMELMTDRYPDYFVGVAVHNGNTNPMKVEEWDSNISTIIAGLYPNVTIMRDEVTDPSSMEPGIISRLQEAPAVFFEHGAEFDESTRELRLSITTNFVSSVAGDNRLFVGLTEDGVTGTTSDYNQSNAFSGGETPMGGYENLPNPVPAARMVYDHVSRALLTPFAGIPNAYGGVVVAGEVRTHGFTFTIPDGFDVANMHIVSAFRNQFGLIDNANSTTIDEAINAGLSTDTYDVTIEANAEVYPNPFSDITNIKMDLDGLNEVSITVTDAMGKLVTSRNYGKVSGEQVFQFDGTNLNSGIYYIKIQSGEKFATKRVILSH